MDRRTWRPGGDVTPATVQSKANDAGRLVESDAGRYPDSHNKNGICRTTSSSDPSGIDCIYIYIFFTCGMRDRGMFLAASQHDFSFGGLLQSS